MFPIPRLEETLESGYLRRQFSVYLNGSATNTSVLSENELSLWMTLCNFFEVLSPLTFNELAASNANNREAASGLFAKFKLILAPFADELSSLLEDPKVVITPNFFRFIELKLYSKKHDDYVAWLKKQIQ